MSLQPSRQPIFPQMGRSKLPSGWERVDQALEALKAGPPETVPRTPLARLEALRKSLGPLWGGRAAEVLELRPRAVAKFARADEVLLVRRPLEQATALGVARARAARIVARLGPGAGVLDATAGLGADACALAAAELAVVAGELDPELIPLLRHNLGLVDAAARVVRADAARPAVRADVFLADPDRRDGAGRRQGHPESWSPPLSVLLGAAGRFRAACLELAAGTKPAFDLELPAAHSLSWTSLAGELKELTLWCGELAGEERREARVLAPDGSEACLEGRADRPVPRAAPVDPAAGSAPWWIGELDPAVLQSGLAGALLGTPPLAGAGLGFLGEDAGYIAGAELPPSPFYRRFRVLGSAPLDRKRVRRLLAEHDVGPLTVKKRALSEGSRELERRLRGTGRHPGLIVATALPEGRRAFLVEAVEDRDSILPAP